MKVLRLFVHHLKCVPWRTIAALRWLIGKMFGTRSYANPRLEELREKHEHGQVRPEDFQTLVVPLLIQGFADFERVQRDAQFARIKSNMQYFIALAVAIIGYMLISDYAKSNRRAIEVSCTVTANVVTRSGAELPRAPGGPTGQPVPLTDPQKLSALRLEALRGVMSPEAKREETRLVARIVVQGGLQVPNCKEIAQHPERVTPFIPNANGPTTTATP